VNKEVKKTTSPLKSCMNAYFLYVSGHGEWFLGKKRKKLLVQDIFLLTK